MKKNDKYIMFNEKQKGRDGCPYIRNVKYRIRKETSNAFYLGGRTIDFTNIFLKSRLKNKFIVGNIIIN